MDSCCGFLLDFWLFFQGRFLHTLSAIFKGESEDEERINFFFFFSFSCLCGENTWFLQNHLFFFQKKSREYIFAKKEKKNLTRKRGFQLCSFSVNRNHILPCFLSVHFPFKTLLFSDAFLLIFGKVFRLRRKGFSAPGRRFSRFREEGFLASGKSVFQTKKQQRF